MKILIDADGCPVVDLSVAAAKKHGAECVIICDTSHVFDKDGARTVVVEKGADSADCRISGEIYPGCGGDGNTDEEISEVLYHS